MNSATPEATCNIVIDKTAKPEWIENVPSEVYHSDRTAVNSSSLKTILKSGFAFKRNFIEGLQKPPTDAMKFGTTAHMAILEGDEFTKRYVVMPEFIGYTKDGKESKLSKEAKDKKEAWLAEQELLGSIVVTSEERDRLFWMIDSVMANPEAVRLLKNGSTEVSGYYSDPETGIRCRIRPDFIAHDLNAMVDVKTVADCDVDWFRRRRVEDESFMYHFQMSMYDEGTSIISGKTVDFATWLLVGSEAPYECIVVPMEQPYREIGGKYYHRALRKLKECMENNLWERQPGLQSMHPSHWFMQKQEES